MKQQKFLTSLLALVLAIVSLHPGFGQAQAQKDEPYVPSGILVSELGDEVPPGRLNVRFPHRDPVQVGEEIRTLLQQPSSTSDRPGPTQTVPAITAEIQTLATGLENDPLAIYDYVYNHIEYIPSWGLLKNPRETLLAGAGNAFDQAALLVALLEAAGLQSRYVWGDIRVTKATAMNWVGSNNSSTVGNIFASGGIPTMDEGSTLRVSHIWVEVCDGGTGPSCSGGVWRGLDPSFKSYTEQAGQDLRTLLDYNLSIFIGHAQSGATITSDYVRNLNHANIQDDLESYALSLVNNLRAGDTFIYPEDLLGSRQIVPVESTSYPSFPPYTVVSTSGQATDIPDSFAYELTIQLPGINYTVNVDDIAGERITIFYECATSADCQELEDGGGIYNVYPAYQVQMVSKLRIGGTVVATGSAVSLGTWQQLDVTIATPMPYGSFSFSQYLTVGEWYALPMRLQTVSNRALSRHIDLLNEVMSQDLDPDDERVLGQILYVLGLSYFNEVDLGDRIDARLAKIVHLPHFSMMIASRNLIVWVDALQRPVALDPASHTVDVRLSFDTAISVEDPADADRERAWFFSAGMRGSAVEHAIIEQLQPVLAVSTVQLLRLAIENGQRIYYITPSNWNAIYPSLNHETHVLNSIVNALNNGRHAVISQNELTYGNWEGSGWIELDPNSGSAGYLISGYVNPNARRALLIISGGGGAFPQPPGDSPKLAISARTVGDSNQEQVDRPDPDETQEALEEAARPKTSPEEAEETDQPDGGTGDPVNATTGSLLYRHVDLAPLGGRDIPLNFERFYVSSRHSLTSTLGYGWSHTYNTRFYTSTDWVRGFGGRTVLEAAPALAAAQVGFDLFDTPTISHQRFATDVIVAHWLMAQITDNAATLGEPDGSVSAYVHLMDGKYEPPAGRPRLDAVTIGGGATLDWEGGRRTHFDANGRLTILEDANGNQTTLSYDAQDRLNQVSDPVGRNLSFSYDAQNRLTQVTDPAGRAFRYGYSAQGDLQTYTDPLGGVTTYAYDAGHRVTTVTDPLGATFIDNQYNALGRVSTQTNGRGGQTRWLYGGDHTIVIDPLGHRTTYDYDERGRLLSIQDPLGNRRSAAYDAADHQVTRTNGLGQDTIFAYDAWGRLTTTTDPLGYSATWGYDSAGNPTGYTDKRGKTWGFAYDAHHNLTSITNPLGETTDYTYDSYGQLTRAENDAGVYATYGYDARGNLTRITNALGESRWGYDIVGRPTSFTDGVGNITQFNYNALDNLVQITDPLGNSTDYAYDANGSLVGITDANGHTTAYAYDAQFNLTSVTDPLGGVTSYDYDANDRLVQVTDANGNQTIYDYDAAGRLTTITDPLGRAVTFTYNAGDQLIAFGRADGSSINYQRDDLGRLTEIDYPTGSDITFEYDAAGNVTHAARGSEWSATFTHDDAGRLSTIQDESRNLITNYEHDAAGRRTRLQVQRDTVTLYDVAYGYNAASRVTTLTDQARTPADVVSLSYDAAGRTTQITNPGGAHTDLTYDAAGRLTTVHHQDGQGADIASYAYTRDPVGHVTAVDETTPVGTFGTTFAYDERGWLVEESYPRYDIVLGYDAVGNLASRIDSMGTVVPTYDAGNQLLTWGSESFAYDLNGNLSTWSSDHGDYSFANNYENILTGLTLPDGTTLSFTHDAFDRRLTFQGPAGTRGYLQDGLSIILEGSEGLDQTTAYYLYEDGSLVARQTDQLGFTAFLGDALDNVCFLTDGNGQPIDAYHYEAYGYPPIPAGVDPNPFRHDGVLGVYQPDVPAWPVSWMGYRDYGPYWRFSTPDSWSSDPFRPQRLNGYLFSPDPVGDSDPTGLRPEREHLGPGAPKDAVAASVRQDGHVLVDAPPRENLSPEREPMPRAAASPTRPETLPVEMPGLPEGKPGVRMSTTSPETSSTRWLPVAAHGSTFALVCTVDNRLLAGAFHAGLFRSLDTGHAIWYKAYTASVGEFAIADANTFYAGTRYGDALKSSNGGGSWTTINTGLAANHVYALVADPATPNRLFAGTEMGLFVSNNGGANWGRPAGTLPGRSVSELAFAGNTLLALSEFGLYRSPDGGSTWLTPTVDLPAVRVNVLLPASPAGTIYAGTALGPYQSTDGGDAWAAWGTGLAGKDVHALAIDPADANHVVAGTTAGLFVSADGGSTWTADTYPGLEGIASQVGALAFCPDGGDDNLYLGAGGGVYALRTPTAPDTVMIIGPITVTQTLSATFTVTVSPEMTTLPLTYTWEATEQTPVNKTGVYRLTDALSFSWDSTGDKTITVTAGNSLDSVSVSHIISVVPSKDVDHYIYLPLVLRNQ